MKNDEETQNSYFYENEYHRPLAPTPSWSPQPLEFSSFQNGSSDYSNQNNINQRFSLPRYYTFGYGNGKQCNPNYHKSQATETDKEVQRNATTAAENGKKISNRESQAYGREHNKRIKESHISNDRIIKEVMEKIQFWKNSDPSMKELIKKLGTDYKPCPIKIRKERKSRRTTQISNTVPSVPPSSGLPQDSFNSNMTMITFNQNPTHLVSIVNQSGTYLTYENDDPILDENLLPKRPCRVDQFEMPVEDLIKNLKIKSEPLEPGNNVTKKSDKIPNKNLKCEI